jgi:hypothetical protein
MAASAPLKCGGLVGGARTAHGVFTRVAQRLLAPAAAWSGALGDQRFRQAQPHRLRPLTRLSFKESII